MSKKILSYFDSNDLPMILDVGINHGGDLQLAMHIVDRIADAGGKIIKHQTHIPGREMSQEARSVFPGNANQSIYDVISDNSLSHAAEKELAAYVKEKGLTFISTPFCAAAVEILEDIDIPFYKIGSGECSNFDVLKAVKQTAKPIILSTGMHSLDEVRRAVEFLDLPSEMLILLHCTNAYPTPLKDVGLDCIAQIRSCFSNKYAIGFSDHTVGLTSSFGALALGAVIIEKHFTHDKTFEGPDISCSIDAQDFNTLKKYWLELKSAKSNVEKRLMPSEEVTRKFAEGSLVYARDLNQDEKLQEEDIVVKRPGTGAFTSWERSKVVGRTLARSVKEDTQIFNDDLGK